MHSLIGSTLSDGFHNATPGLPNDVMNHGIHRSFQNRSGFEVTGVVAPGSLADVLVDHGIFFINTPSTHSQAMLSASFAVPPAFR